MYSLVIVDLQPGFEASNGKRIRRNVLREITWAMEASADIIVLEYKGYSPTHKELISPIKNNNYGKLRTAIKNQDDGSCQVQEIVNAHNVAMANFRCLGVNTDFCVRATALGLLERFPNSVVEVVEDSCDSVWDHQSGINHMLDISQSNNRLKVITSEKENIQINID